MEQEILAVMPHQQVEDIMSCLNEIKALLLEKQSTGPAESMTYVDTRQAAQILSITPHTLGEWRKAGIIQGSKICRKVYYKLSNIVDLIDRNTLNNK